MILKNTEIRLAFSDYTVVREIPFITLGFFFSTFLQEKTPASPTRLHEQAQEEKKRYSALKKQGKDAEALKAFKRAKELERQAEALEKEIDPKF